MKNINSKLFESKTINHKLKHVYGGESGIIDQALYTAAEGLNKDTTRNVGYDQFQLSTTAPADPIYDAVRTPKEGDPTNDKPQS
ncbi:MAG TPA: hypothetical protein VFV37_02145 [Luteibaculaceae bacterium]|nr:hypothetical protein [Luteibaculaceae bacterium]